jgi:membrane associated rhomboid family serine protease
MSEPEDQEAAPVRIAPLTVRIGADPGPPTPARKLPIATISLLAAITLTTGIEFAIAQSADPPPDVLMALGGMNSTAVLSGDWYRLITAALLHGGILHLVLNGVVLFLGGAILESLVNRSWVIFIAVFSAVSGSALGLGLNDASIVSVGASGSIMGILAAGMVLAFRVEAGPRRNQLLGTLARFLIPSLIPLATGGSGAHIDYSAHIGGALGGAAVGVVILGARLFDKVSLARASAIVAISLVAASVGVEVKHIVDRVNEGASERSAPASNRG